MQQCLFFLMFLSIFMDICGGPDKSNLKFESLTPYSGFYKKNFKVWRFYIDLYGAWQKVVMRHTSLCKIAKL